MTPRNRFARALRFEKPLGTLPVIEWAAWWDQTIVRWEQEGMPTGLGWEESVRSFDLDVLYCISAPTIGPGAPQPAHHGAPMITDDASYVAARQYLYPQASIDALVAEADRLRERHERGEFSMRLWLDGFFWFPRTLFGIQNHMYAFYDQAELMLRINRDLAQFHERTLDALFQVLTPDMVGFAEDMSYNNGPMLSEQCFDEFIQPYYRTLIPRLKERGVPVMVDSDGRVDTLIPWIQRAGIDGVYPLERQAGVNVAELRRRHPSLSMMGAYDKMVMTRGEEAMREEFERLLPVMQAGGFIVSVDHQTPPGVSLENYRTYIRLLHEYSRRAAA